MTDTAFTSYDALLDGVREILSSADVGRHQDRGRRRARLYWQLGDAIHTHLLHQEARADYGEGLFKRLSQDLSMDRATLYLTVQCRRSLPNVDTYRQLTWSHCRQVFPLATQAEREFYLRAAREMDWTVRQLQYQIRAGLYARSQEIGSASYRPASSGPRASLRPRRGSLHTYRLIPATLGPDANSALVVDQGFGIRWTGTLNGLSDQRPGLRVTAERHPGRGQAGATYTFHRVVSRSTRLLYTYIAGVERVVDGDTLIVTVDCGFNTVVRQRLRLRGLDAPELGSRAGQVAHERVDELLRESPFIVMSTSRTDKYGRYVADVFYLPQEQDAAHVLRDGIYLNRQLLDEGLARPYP